MKTKAQKLLDYSRNASIGNCPKRFDQLHGAIEIESASQYRASTSANLLRQEFPDLDIACGTDSTIQTTFEHDYENELRIKFDSDKHAQVLKVANKFAEYTTANHTCAIHVHINASSLIGNRNLELPANVRRLSQVLVPLVSVCKRFENAFYAVSGSRMRKTSEWSQPWSDCAFDRLKRTANNPTLSGLADCQDTRTAFLNLRNLQNSNYSPNERTIEFRCFSASTAFDSDEFVATSAHHLEACLFLIYNAISTALSETSKPHDKLRFELKHPTHEKSFQWFLHHCAKRPQLERWKDLDLVHALCSYVWNQSERADNQFTY
mgnify:CR=1 FL=1|tara:strand:+ start:251 stop:1213 length:963 start_codon:yes stop_codon:yes gene_type:complete